MKANPRLLLLLALALTLLGACGLRKNCEVIHDPRRTRTLRICTDKKKYDFGEPIHITFTVTNLSDETLEFNGGDKAALDIRVEGEHWSDGRELTPELTRMTLEPDESRALNWVWPTPGTDLKKVNPPPPEWGLTSIYVFGLVTPRPGASRSAVGVTAYYRYYRRP